MTSSDRFISLRMSGVISESCIPNNPCCSGSAGLSPWANAFGSGRWPRTTSMLIRLPSRNTIVLTVAPTGVPPTMRTNAPESATSFPSNITMTSMVFSPASLAGPSNTSRMMAPVGSSNPKALAISSFTLPMFTPNQPRRTSPYSFNCFTTGSTVFEAIENPIPIEPPEGEIIAVFTPITSPSILNSGPPELPRLIAASVWI